MSLGHEVRRILSRVVLPVVACAGIVSAAAAARATSDSMRAEQKALTDAALEVGRTLEINLDYSNGSIKDVEMILGMIHEEYAKSHDRDGLDGLALEFGAYLVTTIEKNSEAGRWEAHHPELGESTFPFYWRGLTLFPYVWCQKRILDGTADNVWTKYSQFVVKKMGSAKRDSKTVTKAATPKPPSR